MPDDDTIGYRDYELSKALGPIDARDDNVTYSIKISGFDNTKWLNITSDEFERICNVLMNGS